MSLLQNMLLQYQNICSDCYRTVCGLGKAQPKQQMCDTTGDTYHYHLNRYPPRFSEGQVQHKGGFLGDPRGIARGEARS
jgi:hypothetical protein